MMKSRKLAAIFAGAFTLVTLSTTSAFADWRHRDATRRSITTQGRVTRLEHYRDGYRVWLDRGGYPFLVPAARFRAFPLRVGVSVRIRGNWDPRGYYDAYDVGPVGGDLRGVVESVDYRRGLLVLNDDLSGRFVTIVLRGNDRRLGDLRRGDYVDLIGEWRRNGVFEAFSVADVRDRGYDRYRRRY